MKQTEPFLRTVCKIAIPVALQSMLQASFSIIDQVMIGQLGSIYVAGVGLAGKFSSIFSVLTAAVGAIAGIMISQYLGQKNRMEVRRSFFLNLWITIGITLLFTALCLCFPQQIMGLYTQDAETCLAAAAYLRILAGTFLPMAGATLFATLFRCMERASLPLFASIFAAVLNTGLNYILIFGKFGFPMLGAEGAAIATLISQITNFFWMFLLFFKYRTILSGKCSNTMPKFNWPQYAAMLLPVLICEFMWSLGENVYAAIYGHLGTESCAAMTLTNPIQGLTIGALCGLSQAAGVIIGKMLGTGAYDDAYTASKQLMRYGLVGVLFLSALILLIGPYYVKIYQVKSFVRQTAVRVLCVYAILVPVKVLNMILGGILRSGGKTTCSMGIDLIGTWCFGVPLGLLAAFVLQLPIAQVYLLLSLEECVRLGLSLIVFRKKHWMQILKN